MSIDLIDSGLVYLVTRKDLKNYSWYTKVIGADYSCRSVLDKPFRGKIQPHIEAVRKAKIDMVEFNRLIQIALIDLEEEHSEYFNDKKENGGLGWYSKRLLCELYTKGEILVRGHQVKDLLKDREQELLQAKARREVKEELAETERKLKTEKDRLALERLEAARVPVKVGDIFKSKHWVEKAYKEAIDLEIEEKRLKNTLKVRESVLKEFVEVEKGKWDGGIWKVVRVGKEGGRG